MPVIAHYGSEWAELYNQACDVAGKIFKISRGFVTILPVPGAVSIANGRLLLPFDV
jgi:hypothetical protein